jgi:hypothetical protein
MSQRNSHASYFIDEKGRRLARVPVSGSDAPMVTEAALYDNARQSGSLRGALFLSGAGKRRRYVYAWHLDKAGNSTAARLLINCPKGYQVRYIDGNPLNMLPENFRLVATWGDQALAGKVLEQLLAEARRAPDEMQEWVAEFSYAA